MFSALRQRALEVPQLQDLVNLTFRCFLLVLLRVDVVNFGLNASPAQPPTWNRRDSAALAPSTPVAVSVTLTGAQFVGWNVTLGRSKTQTRW
jgi:hypothetical protein